MKFLWFVHTLMWIFNEQKSVSLLAARHCIRLQRRNVGTELGPDNAAEEKRPCDVVPVRVQHASLSHAWLLGVNNKEKRRTFRSIGRALRRAMRAQASPSIPYQEAQEAPL